MKDMPMKKIFSIWLTVFVMVAFALTMFFSYNIQSRLARETALTMINRDLKEAEKRISETKENLGVIKKLTVDVALGKARAFSRIIKDSPELANSLAAFNKAIDSVKDKASSLDLIARTKLYQKVIMECPEYEINHAYLERLIKSFEVSELTVTNGDGIMVSSIPTDYIGYDMSSKEQSNEFVQHLLVNGEREYVQDPMPNGYWNKIFQYVGTKRVDDNGFVQIGYSAQKLHEAEKLADIYSISKAFKIGNNGKLEIKKAVDAKEAVELLNGEKQKSVREKIDGNYYLCVYRQYNDSKETLELCIKNLVYSIIELSYVNSSKICNLQSIIMSLSYCFEQFINTTKLFTVPSLSEDDKIKNTFILKVSLPEDEMFLSRNTVLKTMGIAYFVLFSVIFVLISLLLQMVVIKGIYSVNDSLNKITEGNLNETVKVHNTKEFDVLSKGINATVDALKKAIEAESKRIDAELEIGRTIQNSVLPVDFPDNDIYSICASMNAAKEVGGDFYDFFAIDEKHNAMIIADVSGKGITAALFMMNAKALLKELILLEKSPAIAIEKVNKELCVNNEARMFVTVFIAILNTETGEMICVNAGHNPPLLRHDGVWEYQKIKHSMALGVSKKAKFTEVSLKLTHNDSFFMYTDGVTEAQNVNNELFGEQRLKDFLSKQDNNPKNILSNLREELKRFAGEAPQSDDITMIMGLYK